MATPADIGVAGFIPKAGDRIVLPPAVFGGSLNTPSRTNLNNVWDIWSFVQGTDRRLATFLYLPAHWSTFHVDLWWASVAGGAGNVAWRYGRADIGAGDDATTAATFTSVITAGGSAGITTVTRLKSDEAIPAAGKAYGLTVNRHTTSDTLASATAMLAAVLTRAT